MENMTMRERLTRFMMGRYGFDEYSKFLSVVALILLILNFFSHSGILYILALAAIVYIYYRVLSRDHSKRYRENVKYIQLKDRVTGIFRREKSYMEQRKTHHIYTCKGCGQKIRIPRGKGKIAIRCPKCNTEFIKRS